MWPVDTGSVSRKVFGTSTRGNEPVREDLRDRRAPTEEETPRLVRRNQRK